VLRSDTDAPAPHGGYKQSGYGKDMSKYSFDKYTNVKHVMSDITGCGSKGMALNHFPRIAAWPHRDPPGLPADAVREPVLEIGGRYSAMNTGISRSVFSWYSA
jgi:Aldehyde dehydrogenase family